VTHDGRKLAFSPNKGARTSTFSRESRFSFHKEAAGTTSAFVGPGKYKQEQLSMKENTQRTMVIMRPYTAGKNVENGAYYNVGDQMVFDGGFLSPKKRGPLYGPNTDFNCGVDATGWSGSSSRFRRSAESSRISMDRTQSFKRIRPISPAINFKDGHIYGQGPQSSTGMGSLSRVKSDQPKADNDKESQQIEELHANTGVKKPHRPHSAQGGRTGSQHPKRNLNVEVHSNDSGAAVSTGASSKRGRHTPTIKHRGRGCPRISNEVLHQIQRSMYGKDPRSVHSKKKNTKAKRSQTPGPRTKKLKNLTTFKGANTFDKGHSPGRGELSKSEAAK